MSDSYTVVDRTAHSRTWRRVDEMQRVHEYVELSTGLCYTDKAGRLVDSRPVIELLPGGVGAVAERGQHKVYFPPTLDGLIELNTPDGTWLRSRVIGLAYMDVDGRSVLIGEVKPSVGVLTKTNVMVYPDAFEGVSAGVRYTYTLAAFEQDIVIEKQLPPPGAFGLSDNAKLQVLTEFVDPPEPVRESRNDNGFLDEHLSWDTMRMGRGTGFALGEERNRRQGEPIGKRWEKLLDSENGGIERAFLIEEVDYKKIEPKLRNLPPRTAMNSTATNSVLNRVANKRLLPSPKLARHDTNVIQHAKAELLTRPAYVLDYTIINTSQEDFTFSSGQTYYVSSSVYFSGTTTIQGAVIKFARYADIYPAGPWAFQTTPQQMAVLTAVDDDTVGETISGSSGTPTGYYANWAFGTDWTGNVDFHDFEIRYAAWGIVPASGVHTVRNCRFIHTGIGIWAQTSITEIKAYNVLFENVETAFGCNPYNCNGTPYTVDAQHVTYHDVTQKKGSSSITLTELNCLFENNPGTYTAGLFGGNSYLAANSQHRNVGTTAIDANLLTAIRTMTTYAPQHGGWLDSGAPDRGYHYPVPGTTVSVSATEPDAWESDEDPGVFTITRRFDNIENPLTVNFQISGTATGGTDYSALGTQVTIPAGAASRQIYVWPFKDQIAEGTETVVLTLGSGGYVIGGPASATISIYNGLPPALADPKTPGSFSFSSVVYASSDVQKIPWYQSPSSGYSISRRLDISPFFNSVNDGYWGFDSESVPINGMLRVPDGTGPFPLAIFVHGKDDPEGYSDPENPYSDPGFIYLCDLLASRGIIAATIDENFLNQGGGEVAARAIVHLEHVRQFAIWNATAGHPLYGKVDLNHIMLVGHSRGGEGVGHAGYYNTYSGNDPVPLDGSAGLGPYSFDLKALVAIAPTDGEFVPPSGPTKTKNNYLIIHGSRDGDVRDFRGYKTYDRAHPIDPVNPVRDANGFKALAWIVGANHNYFNSTWLNENISHTILTRTEQENVAKVYISAMAEATLLGHRQYLKFLKNHDLGADWLPSSGTYVSQYQAANRLFINHYEEDTDTAKLSPPLSGANSWNTPNFTEMFFNNGGHLYQETHGVRFSWSAPSQYYQMSFSGDGLNANGYGHLVLRIGQSGETENPAGADQDLRIIVQDSTGASASFVVSALSRLVYPDVIQIEWPVPLLLYKTVMQTVRVPLNDVRMMEVDVAHIASVKLVFDQVSTGTMYFDEIQLSN